MSRCLVFYAAFLVFFGSSAAWGRLPDRDEHIRRPRDSFEIRTDYETPHIKWDKPSAAGRLKTLLIAPRWNHRESVELLQRFDLDAVVFMSDRKDKLGDAARPLAYGSATAEERAAELMKKLAADFDVIVVGNMDCKALLEPTAQAILAKVEAGCGLVLVYGDNLFAEFTGAGLADETEALLAELRNTTPLRIIGDASDEFTSTDDLISRIKVYRHGGGRVIVLGFDQESGHSYLAPRVETAMEYEYALCLAFKAMRYASQSDRSVSLQQISAENIDRSSQNTAKLTLRIKSQTDITGAIIEIAIHSQDQHSVQPTHTVVDIPASPSYELVVEAAVPDGVQGEYLADSWIRNAADDVLDFGSTTLSITEPDAIAELNVTMPLSLEHHSVVTGVVSFNAPPAVADSLRVSLMDGFGRLLAEQNYRLQDKQIRFSLRAPRLLHLYAQLKAELCKADRVTDAKTVQIPVSARVHDGDWTEVSLMTWGGVGRKSYLDQITANRLAELGSTQHIMYGYDPYAQKMLDILIPANIRFLPYCTKITLPPSGDTKAFSDIYHHMRKCALQCAPYGTDVYSMGDETIMSRFASGYSGDAGANNEVVAMLRQSYAGIDSLNDSWGSSYATWQDVDPAISYEEAQQAESPSKWVDVRNAMNRFYSGIHRAGAQGVKSVDRRARVGYEGINHVDTWHGNDFWSNAEHGGLSFSSAYCVSRQALLQAGDFYPADSMLQWFTGSYPDMAHPAYYRRVAWRALFDGANNFGYWATVQGTLGDTTWYGFIAPDYTLHSNTKGFVESVAEIQAGIGRLLLAAGRRHDGVALHHSWPNMHISAIGVRDFNWQPQGVIHYLGKSRLCSVWDGTTLWLEDCGLKYKWLAGDQIERGQLDSCRALVLPFSQILTEAESEAIRNFVKNGGTVIADVRPGIYNEHGERLEHGQLEDVFGVKWRSDVTPATTGPVTVEGKIGTTDISGVLIDAQVDPAVEAVTAEAMLSTDRGTGAVMLNQFGQGRAILLNLMHNYSRPEWFQWTKEPPVRGTDNAAIYGEIISAALAVAGIEPQVKLTHNGQLPGPIDVTCFGKDNRFYGVCVNAENGDFGAVYNSYPDLNVQLPASGHVYDVRAGQYLGYRNNITFDLNPGDAHLWASLPYKVNDIKISGPDSLPRGATATFSLRIIPDHTEAAVGLHVFHVELIDPAGRTVKAYSANATAQAGRTQLTIPLALNDLAGLWRVVVQDVASNLTAQKTFILGPEQ